tara:strand:- start:15709 stop:15963 length:255 start_codon:yes stop_codon:yes gene_type:complete
MNINGVWKEVGITLVMIIIENLMIFNDQGEEWIGTSSMFLNQFHRLYTKDQDDKLHGIEARLKLDEDLLDLIDTIDERIANINR